MERDAPWAKYLLHNEEADSEASTKNEAPQRLSNASADERTAPAQRSGFVSVPMRDDACSVNEHTVGEALTALDLNQTPAAVRRLFAELRQLGAMQKHLDYAVFCTRLRSTKVSIRNPTAFLTQILRNQLGAAAAHIPQPINVS